MKIFFRILFFGVTITILLYGLLLLVWNLKYTSEIGKLFLVNQKDTYFVFNQKYDVDDEFDSLYFDFYNNGKVLSQNILFDYTDGDSKIEDYRLISCNEYYYVTNFEKHKVKIILDSHLNVVYPVDSDFQTTKIDSLENNIQVSIMENLKKCDSELYLDR